MAGLMAFKLSYSYFFQFSGQVYIHQNCFHLLISKYTIELKGMVRLITTLVPIVVIDAGENTRKSLTHSSVQQNTLFSPQI